MTPAERIEKVFDDAHCGNCELSGAMPRDAEETLNQLIQIIDNRELYDAMGELLKAEGRAPNLVPY
jgi:hypothetical protein